MWGKIHHEMGWKVLLGCSNLCTVTESRNSRFRVDAAIPGIC